jgi:nucleotide-binding universal stress UspA family protein
MKKDLQNILVPVDFNESSLKAAKYAYYIAKKIKAKIVLLNVMEISGVLLDLFSSGDELVKLSDKIKDNLQTMIDELKEEGQEINISSKIERGKPYQKILDVAEEIDARMIILGENHQGELKTKNLGSTVYHVTLKSPIPVITYKGTHDKVVDKIVVPLDLTKQTKKQILSAMTYGLNYDSKIYFVSALIGGIKFKESRIYKKLNQAKKTLEQNGVDSEIKLFERSEIAPYQKVLDFAKEIKADMILVMTHQEGYTFDNYIGAFAHHIINESDVSVVSLTSSATSTDYKSLLAPIVDPFAIFK